ncbi:MAG: hypothetical protein NVV74_26185 [Magnetospirillum sp.]|nr:hypothetical protein [Magnetospirillum sp.]
MASSSANYEIQILRDGRWSAQSYVDKQETAIAAAKRYLMDHKCEGAKVIHNWSRPDGKIVEKEIFSEVRNSRDEGPVRIVEVDSAPPRCEATQDYYGAASRGLMNRILRNYLEKVLVTPTELLHNYRELKRVQDKDMLVPSAVDRVAFLQTRGSQQDSRVRRDEIHKAIDAMSARARRAEGLKLPKLSGTFHQVIAAIDDLGEAEETDYLALVALSRHLLDTRNWLGKLDRLCRLAQQEAHPRALDLLDGVVADVLGANVVQEILGWQPSLASAIIHMIDLSEGNLPAEKSDAGPSAELLNALLKDDKLPAAKAALVDRALRQLKSANALYRTDPSKERAAYASVVERMVTPSGLLFGPEGAEALTLRQTRMVEEGGATGRRVALQATYEAMPDKAFGLIYLCELARSDFGSDNAPDIMVQLDRVLEATCLGELCQRTLSAKDRMMRATLAHHTVSQSVFPEATRKRLAELIDGILEKYLVEEQVIEKLDHHESALRDRAMRLVQFAAAGVLPEGRAMARARQRIVALLRSPNFDAHFIDGISDPAKAQKALRDFHQLLVRAGFG